VGATANPPHAAGAGAAEFGGGGALGICAAMTSIAHPARRTAVKARNNGLLEALIRAGFVGCGLLHKEARDDHRRSRS
jgi:hypothetical protein